MSVALKQVAPEKAEAVAGLEARIAAGAGAEKAAPAEQLANKMNSICREMSPKEQAAFHKAELKSIDWRTLWGIPAIFSGAVMLVFVALFHAAAAHCLMRS